jgi:chitinase
VWGGDDYKLVPPKPEEKANYITLLKNLRTELDKLGRGKVLSIAAPGKKEDIDRSMDVPNIVKYVDFIGVMSYDLMNRR